MLRRAPNTLRLLSYAVICRLSIILVSFLSSQLFSLVVGEESRQARFHQHISSTTSTEEDNGEHRETATSHSLVTFYEVAKSGRNAAYLAYGRHLSESISYVIH